MLAQDHIGPVLLFGGGDADAFLDRVLVVDLGRIERLRHAVLAHDVEGAHGMDLEILRVLGVHDGVAVDEQAVSFVAAFAFRLDRVVPVDVLLACLAVVAGQPVEQLLQQPER